MSTLCKARAKISGTVPLIMHNGEMADPLGQFAEAMKEFSGKKTEADYREIARLEWLASAYIENGALVMPSDNIMASMRDAGKKLKKGKATLTQNVLRGVSISPDNVLLQFQGPKDPAALAMSRAHTLRKMARVGTARIIRTRPKFMPWSLEFVIEYNDGQLDESDIKRLLDISGAEIGLGDWRPKYGRFTVESLKF